MRMDSDRKIAEKILWFVDLKGKKVLEVGCGNGRISSLIAASAEQLIAIDPDELKIDEAKAVVGSAEFQVGSGEKLDFPDKVFDVVIFTLSLHHQNCLSALQEAKRVLKKNGSILVVEPIAEGEVEKLFALLINENQAKYAAQKAILNSDLNIDKAQVFDAKWIFENIEDLKKSPFDYYEMEFDSQIAKRIVEQVGKKADSVPIVLEDLMIIQSLS